MNRFKSHFLASTDLAGKLLIAAPHLQGTPFARSVIYVLQDDQQGVFGVILNNPASREQRAQWEQVSSSTPAAESLVAGPVGGPVFALHQDEEIAELEIGGGIFISRDQAALDKLATTETSADQNIPYRIVLGVVGFQEPQIKALIAGGHWHVIDGEAALIFEDAGYIWEDALRAYGDQIAYEVTGIDPRCCDGQNN